jgi:hypothetical protein
LVARRAALAPHRRPVESRDEHGDFFPPGDQIAAALLAADCERALDALMTALHGHTGGHGHDDMALLLLERDLPPRSSAMDGQQRRSIAETVNLPWIYRHKPLTVTPARCPMITSDGESLSGTANAYPPHA